MDQHPTSRVRRVIESVVAVVTAIGAASCAPTLSQPMPDVKGPLTLKVLRERASKMSDLPIGAYQIPDTSVYVSGHQGTVHFGLIDAAVVEAVGQRTGMQRVQNVEAQLRLDIAAATERLLADELERHPDTGRFGLPGGRGDSSLEIVPYLILTFIDNDQVGPWVVMKTSLKDARGDEKWKTRYIAGGGETRPLGGESGWASGEEPLRKMVDRGLRAGIDVLLRDASGGLPRGTGRTVKVKGHWVGLKEPLEVAAQVLDETEETLIVIPKVAGDTAFAGVNILDRKSVVVTGAPK